jgi:sugar transferase (PEP-CTERM/EpsH1 system associated)
MKLLMVSGYLPHPSWGAAARSYHLLRALARQHTISLLALAGGVEPEMGERVALLEDVAQEVHVVEGAFRSGKRWKQLLSLLRGQSYQLQLYSSTTVQQKLNELLLHGNYDAVIFESMFLAGYQLPVPVAVVIDQHNIEHELLRRTYEYDRSWLRRWYNWLEYWPLRREEIARCKQADLLLVTSDREQELLSSLLPGKKIAVVPNGVDISTFSRLNDVQELAHQIVFTGTMDYYPNSEAVLSFAQQCWPRIQAKVPDATWMIVGRNPSLAIQDLGDLPGVTVTGSVPDVRPYLARSAVALAPLHIGSGTRLKILEALAMEKAVVATSVGCEGLDLVSGEHLLIADQPEAFAHAVVDLLLHPERRKTLAQAGHALVQAHYSWEQCGERFSQALVLGRKEEGQYIC